jgi:hypothetical protein
MKTKLFDDPNLSPREITDNLEAENCGIEESHEFIKPFTEEELVAREEMHLNLSKEVHSLNKQLEAVSSPIKEQLKPKNQDLKVLIQEINQGGQETTEKVYLFPDHESKLMGLYDSRGILVGTRQMNRAERQLHIFGNINKAI